MLSSGGKLIVLSTFGKMGLEENRAFYHLQNIQHIFNLLTDTQKLLSLPVLQARGLL